MIDCDCNELYDKYCWLNRLLYGNDNLRVSNVMICHYLVSSVVAWKVVGDVETPLE